MPVIRLQDSPAVAPVSPPGNDYQNISAPVGAFGGSVAQAGERVGQQLEQAGSNVTGIGLLQAERSNQVATDAAVNQFQTFATAATYGDQSDPSAPAGFLTLKGQAAVDAGGDALSSLRSKQAQIAASLPTDAARLDFDRQSRRLLDYKTAEIGQHLTQEKQNLALGVSADMAANAKQATANAWNSDETFGDAQLAAQKAEVRAAQTKYGSNLAPEMLAAARVRANTGVVASRVDRWSLNDPSAALSWLQHGTILGLDLKPSSVASAIDPATYDTLVERLRPAVRAQGSLRDLDTVFNGAPAAVRGDGAMAPNALASIPDPATRQLALEAAEKARMPVEARAAWISAVHNESHWNLNAPDGGSGEIGPGQIMPLTGAEMGYTTAQLRVPATNLEASARYFTQQWQRSGGDVAGALRGYNGGSPGVMKSQPYADQAMQRMAGWAPGGVPAAAPPVVQAAAAPGQRIPIQHADERFPAAPSPAQLLAPDANTEFPGVPPSPHVDVPPGGGYVPGGPVPVPTPDSPHDKPAVPLGGAGLAPGGVPLSPGAPPQAAPDASPSPAVAPVQTLPGRPSLEAMLQRVSTLHDPAGVDDLAYQQLMQSRVRARYSEQLEVDRERQKADRDVLLNAAMGGTAGAGLSGAVPPRPTSLDQVLANPAARKAWLDATPEMQHSILQVIEHNARGEDPPLNPASQSLYYRLSGQAVNDPASFAQLDLSDPQYTSALPHSYWNTLVAQQRTVSNRTAQDAQRVESQTRALSILKPDLLAAGIKVDGLKPGTPAAATYDQFVGRLRQSLDDYQAANGKRPGDADMAKIGQTLLLQGTERGSGWLFFGDHGVRAFQTDPAKFAPTVPPAVKQQISAAYAARNNGAIPTDAQVQQIFMAGQAQATAQQPSRRSMTMGQPAPGTAGAPVPSSGGRLPLAQRDEGAASATAPPAPAGPPKSPSTELTPEQQRSVDREGF